MHRAALVLLTACWTGDVPPPAAPPPPPVHHRRVPVVRRLTVEEQTEQLADQLRAQPVSELPALIDRGVVVLDLATGTVATLCDAAALGEAQGWAQLLADPMRTPLTCHLMQTLDVQCVQFGLGSFLVLDLQRAGDDWRLIGVMVGTPSTNLSNQHAQYQAQLSALSCP